jgi:hypothetical protein
MLKLALLVGDEAGLQPLEGLEVGDPGRCPGLGCDAPLALAMQRQRQPQRRSPVLAGLRCLGA